MRLVSRTVPLLLLAGVYALACSAGIAQEGSDVRPEAEVPLGLQMDKPASGPFVKTDRGYMVPYTQSIPGTKASFEMLPIPGGTFRMGSPESEQQRRDDLDRTAEDAFRPKASNRSHKATRSMPSRHRPPCTTRRSPSYWVKSPTNRRSP